MPETPAAGDQTGAISVGDFTRLSQVVEEISVLEREQAALTQRLIDALATYEQMITDHDLGITVPCGFRPSAHRDDRTDDAIFWRLLWLNHAKQEVVFNHECGRDHYAGCSHDHEKWLHVPILFFTHPDEWLLLAALSGQEAP